MKHYYFIGGPRIGSEDAFVELLEAIGGPPPGWLIYPHANRDGRALHVIETDAPNAIVDHLERFGPIYERGPIVEVVKR
jgi:hypothetical protein